MNWSGWTPPCWCVCSTVAGPLKGHQAVCPPSRLLESRASRMAKRTEMAISTAGSPVHCGGRLAGVSVNMSYLGSQHTEGVALVLHEADPEVLRDVLGRRRLVLPRVLGEQLPGDRVVLDLFTSPQPQPHGEGSFHLTDVNLRTGGHGI